MPIYEYRCNKCGAISEYLIGIGKGETDIVCRSCGSKEIEKILSTPTLSKCKHMFTSQGGHTCCGRQERCDTPPCSGGGGCRR